VDTPILGMDTAAAGWALDDDRFGRGGSGYGVAQSIMMKGVNSADSAGQLADSLLP
jgi:hypothetical protein